MANAQSIPTEINESDFPTLFCQAEATSKKAQKTYLRLVTANLITLVLGAFVSSFAFTSPIAQQLLAYCGAFSLLVSFFLMIGIKQKKYEEGWYGGRAIAESVKNVSWRYMTGAEPFQISLTPADVDRAFTERIREILGERQSLAYQLEVGQEGDSQITQEMRQIRGLGTEKRKGVYVSLRIQDQIDWYRSRAERNRKSQERWFWIIIASQGIAVLSGFWAAEHIENPVNFTGILAAIAAAFLGWLQVKRHQELTQAYVITANDLTSSKTLAEHILTDEQLSSFVNVTENAISREHTLWVARREMAE